MVPVLLSEVRKLISIGRPAPHKQPNIKLDPAEYESILKVLGGKSVRSTPMPIGSVKGLIGHTECTSGVVALIRVILMLHHGIIPPQASYQSASPRLKASPDHMLEICTKTTAWNATNRHALINNYGASGSNASMIVSQPPKVHDDASCHTSSDSTKHAFWITGLDERSIRDYAGRLKGFLASKPGLGLANLSFNMYRQSNRTLPQGLIFSCGSLQELEMKMNGYADGGKDLTTTTKRLPRPVVLCFGGQISKHIGLDRTFYECTTVFRDHLDRCNLTLMSLGHANFYPMIFEKKDVGDPVRLQTMLFALQYSCAQCWIDCGVKPVAVVGHSFGELTALCVAGILSLKDSLRVVAARAQLIKDLWASDSGAMMAVEGDLDRLQVLLEQAARTCPGKESATVACHNGPTTFTLAGSTNAINAVERCISSAPGLRGKKLNVSNAFHSALVEPLVADLEKIAADIQFREPTIHWERATESRSSPMVEPRFFASHMREPVFAFQAFERLHRDFPSAIWLEAGSNSTITKMANKALGTPADSFFTDINITSDSALQKLTDTFVTLWQEGLTIPHWSHHHTQAHIYSPVFLPPYQFEKARHWLELKKPLQLTEQNELPSKAQHEELPTTLYTFSSQDDAKGSARFRINTMSKIYNDFVSGHLIVHTAAICPATLEVDIAIEAVLSLHPELVAQSQPETRNVENQAPICQDSSRLVWLDLQATTSDFRAWNWQIISTNAENSGKMTHVKGQISFRSNEDNAEFARFERLMTHQACTDVLHSSQPDDVLQGRNLYKVFSEIVDYSEPYRGLQKLVGKGNTSAGRVVKAHSGVTWLDPHLSDCFSQVGGFWVNCMTDKAPTDMYIAAGFESWFRRSDNKHDKSTSVWDVIAYHNQTSDRAYTTDIFIFEAATGTLCEVILGIHYARIPKATMSKTLMKLTASTSDEAKLAVPSTQATPTVPTIHPSIPPTKGAAAPVLAPIPATKPNDAHAIQSKAVATVVEILADLSGVEVDVIKISTRLADIGIDSLVGMEMVHDLDSKFGCSLDLDQMAEVVTVHDVVQCVQATLGIQGDIIDSDSGSSPTSGTQSPRSTQSSATSGSDSERVVKSVEDIQLPVSHKVEELQLAASDVLGAFHETKKLTDQFIVNFGCSGYMDTINPKQTQLCIALVVEAFEKLGCNLRTAKAGAVLQRISHAPQHARLAQYLYSLLEKEGRLIDVDGDTIVRTAVSPPQKSSKDLLDHLVAAFPDHVFANRLAFYCGTRLVEVLQGSLDGVKLIFGSDEGRQLVSGLYGDSLLNKIFYKLMEETMSRLVTRLPRDSGPLKILEMGAGTGGTTKYLAPLLAKLGVPVEYTFTDLAPSFVALARRTFKAYPFMKFRAHDIEHVPADDLIGTQHIVIASNAVHATHSLTVSAKNIRKALRPDGFLMMLEMTETLPWVDIIFGLLEGWWLFDDGRWHAISHQSHWERELQAVGYGHVDWTDGQLPENQIQRIIIAMASGAK
jgi:malonyl CoA-acyl carrier protein transacylase/acyl carrier protein/SAM-dependent methyltransferase